MSFRKVGTISALAACLSACSDPAAGFDHLYYRNVSEAPGQVNLRPREIELTRGIAVRARVTAIGDDGAPMDALDLRSGQVEIFQVDPGPRLGEYVFYGVQAGSAELDVFSEGRFQTSLPVEVLEPD